MYSDSSTAFTLVKQELFVATNPIHRNTRQRDTRPGKAFYPLHNDPIGHHIPDALLRFHFSDFALKGDIKRIAVCAF